MSVNRKEYVSTLFNNGIEKMLILDSKGQPIN